MASDTQLHFILLLRECRVAIWMKWDCIAISCTAGKSGEGGMIIMHGFERVGRHALPMIIPYGVDAFFYAGRSFYSVTMTHHHSEDKRRYPNACYFAVLETAFFLAAPEFF